MQHIFKEPSGRMRAVTRRDRQRGMTLIEFMISITIGLILVAGLALLFASQSGTQAELEKSSRQIENGRYAIQLLKEDVQLAGYYGEFYNTSTLTVPTLLPDPCLATVADLSAAMAFPVQGYNSPASLPATSCPINAANFRPGTDILVVRHADTATTTTSLKPGKVYLQAGLTATKDQLKYVLGVAASTALDTAVFNLITKTSAVAPLRQYIVHVYYISPCSVPSNGSACSAAGTDDGGVSVPTLKRLELSVAGGVPTFTTVSLVEGVENLQVDYGFDTVDTVPNPKDGSPDSYATDAAAVADWASLVTVRMNLLARNNERSAGYVDDKTYNLGLAGSTVATNDGFKRHVFSQMVRVVNPSARRAQ